MGAFDDRAVFISGAASGIGRAAALRLAAEGANLLLADRDDDSLAETASLITGNRPQVRTVVLDVTDADAVEAAVGEAIDVFGRLDGALNGAAILGPHASIVDYPAEDFSRLLEVNVTGMFHCLKAQLRHMTAQGSGSIVNMASSGGIRPMPRISGYIAAKHAVIGLTRSAALEVGGRVRVNALCPGLTKTNMVSGGDPAHRAAMTAEHPIGRMAEPEEIVEAIIWLLSDKASFVTGAAMVADGGFTIG